MLTFTDILSPFPAEAGTVEKLLGLMHDENGIGDWSTERVKHAIANTINSGQVMLIHDGPVPIGTYGLQVQDWWYSKDRFVGDLWFYIHPDHRSLRIFRAMVSMARSYARGLDLPLLMGVVSLERPLAKTRLYRRFGRPVGGMFLMEEGDGVPLR